MRIVSWNVNGIRAVARKGFAAQIAPWQADIICLQETKAQADEVAKALEDLDGWHLYANSAERKGYSGTGVLSRTAPRTVRAGIGIPAHDQEGRVITADYGDFYLVNVYVPNSGSDLARLSYRQEWDRDFRAYLVGLREEKPVIMCGDLNVAHQPIDLARPKENYNKTSGYTQQEIDGMTALLGAGFADTYRRLRPTEAGYSWWSARFGARQKNIGWRIDYFVVSDSLLPKVRDSFIWPHEMGSDHCPVGIDLDL